MEILFPGPKPVGAKRRLLIKAKIWKKQSYPYELNMSADYDAFCLDPNWGVEITY